MATRSSIAVMQNDGKIKSIYCHSDGYTDGVGATLLKSYNDEKSANELVSLGWISCLYDNVSPLPEAPPAYPWRGNAPIKAKDHHFDNPQENVTVAYHRDRGEAKRVDEFDSLANYVESGNFQGYDYLFMNNAWHIEDGGEWTNLVDCMKAEAEEVEAD